MMRFAKRRQFRALAMILACIAISGPSAAEVKVRYLRGQPTFVSTAPASVVEIAIPAAARDRRVAIGVIAFNAGSRPANLGYENVTVRTTSGLPIKLLTFEELQHQARVRAGWATFFAVLAAGANGYAAAESGYGHVGPYRYYSPVAAQISLDRASAQNDAMFASISSSLDAALARLDGTVLRTSTIDPGASFGGAVVFDLPKGVGIGDLVVTVTFDGEIHSLPLDASSPSLQQASAVEMMRPTPAIAPDLQPVPQRSAAVAAPSTDSNTQTLLRTAQADNSQTPPSRKSTVRKHQCKFWSPTNPSAVTCPQVPDYQ